MATAAEIEGAIAVLLGGRVAQVGVGAVKKVRAEQLAFQALGRRSQARVLATGAGRAGRFVGRQAITKNPWGIAAVLAYEGYIHRDEIAEVAESIVGVAREAAIGEREAMGPPGLSELSFDPRRKRKVSKANKAVKHAMSLLKAGSKRSTGAGTGILPKGAFRLSVKAAGLANPNTKSKIGKGKGRLKALARKIRSWW
jgi:hypothetical protein